MKIMARLHQASGSMHSQRCDDASDTALMEINGNKLESLQNGVATHFLPYPFFSVRARSQASSPH